LDKDSVVEDGALPVGYPVEDMEVLILDEGGNELYINSIGEIALRSKYLFPGYWNNPALTTAAFLPLDGQGRRIFRTGDLGRLRPDGCLEYCGRKDFRLKIRGHSIQTEEVELALLRVPGIVHAAVAARKDSHGDDRLVAYTVTDRRPAQSISELRQRLREWLPEYMIPTHFVDLPSLPLLPNGKVDRQALPIAPKLRPNLSTAYVESRTSIESVITNVWSKALGMEAVGVHDNFFDLGGDSLIASKIVSDLNRIFPWNLTLSDFFVATTVAGLAAMIIAKQAEHGQADRVARAYLKVERMSPEEISEAMNEARLRD
jgi:hypothetical protein